MFVVLSHLILGSFGEQQWTTDAKAFPLLSPTRMAPGSSGSSVLAVTRLVLWPSVPLLRAVLGQGQNLAHRVFQDVSRAIFRPWGISLKWRVTAQPRVGRWRGLCDVLLLHPSGWQDCQGRCPLSGDCCYRETNTEALPGEGLCVH